MNVFRTPRLTHISGYHSMVWVRSWMHTYTLVVFCSFKLQLLLDMTSLAWPLVAKLSSKLYAVVQYDGPLNGLLMSFNGCKHWIVCLSAVVVLIIEAVDRSTLQALEELSTVRELQAFNRSGSQLNRWMSFGKFPFRCAPFLILR